MSVSMLQGRRRDDEGTNDHVVRESAHERQDVLEVLDLLLAQRNLERGVVVQQVLDPCVRRRWGTRTVSSASRTPAPLRQKDEEVSMADGD